MKVLVACEESGVVREAFRLRGHDAYSCDLVPARDGSHYHLQMDAIEAIKIGWDLMIAHPPCTDLCVSGALWFKYKKQEQAQAIAFFMAMINAPIERIAVENPVCIMSTIYRKPDQYIQPWMFGHGETKKTGLWLKNLPKLVPTNIVEGRENRIHKMPPSPTRARDRSTTYQGIADAMADQWGAYDH